MNLSEARKQSREAAASAPIFAKPFLWVAAAVVLAFSALIALVFGFTKSMRPLYRRRSERD